MCGRVGALLSMSRGRGLYVCAKKVNIAQTMVKCRDDVVIKGSTWGRRAVGVSGGIGGLKVVTYVNGLFLREIRDQDLSYYC